MTIPKSEITITSLHNDPLLQAITSSLNQDKACDIVTINLQGKTALADALVVASGTSNRHISSMAKNLMERLKPFHLKRLSIEGLQNCLWVLIDTGDVVIHLFHPELRSYYNLERMWDMDFPRENPEVRDQRSEISSVV